jgi:hypothetical protein
MKKIVIALTLTSSLMMANSIDINQLKWTEDFETLVNLSSSTENSLEGIDQNENGVRDDVEYYVNTKYKNRPFQKAMFIKAAGMMQKIITLPNNQTALKAHQKLDRDLLNVYTCRDYILYKMGSESLEKEMQEKINFKAKVLNTKKRLHAYIAHKELLPFQFDDLTQEQLEKDKEACISQYNRYTNSDSNLIFSTK